MKIIFFGTPQFSVPTLELLFSSKHEILAVITGPDIKKGRGLKIHESPVSKISQNLSLDIIKPAKLSDSNFITKLHSYKADLFIVVAYKILPAQIFNMPKYGTINLHASLLPKYRGAAPIQRAILNGETITGLTTFKIEKKVDVGAVYLSKIVKINRMNYGELYEELSKVGSALMLKTINSIENDTITPYQQGSDYSFAHKINNSVDCKIIWSNNAESIINLIRAFSPYPGAFTMVSNKRLKIFSASINKSIKLKKREISILDNKIYIGSQNHALEIKELQYEGKKKMKACDFLNGNSFNGNYCRDE